MVDVVVVGGGPAGVTAALRARELGAQVTLIEAESLGGTCTNDGCVPTRVLAHAARLVRDSEQFDRYGLIGERPQVDFPLLLSRAQQIVYQVHEKKQLLHHLDNAGVKVYVGVGRARFTGPNTLATESGETIQGERFILAAGGHARQADFPGSELALTHSDVWSLARLPKSVVFVGGSATGCQMASAFQAFGSRVWVLEVTPRILRTEDELVAQVVTEEFRKKGIEIIAGISGIERIEELGAELVLHYTNQGGSASITAEAVVMAIGWPGNAPNLNLEAAGVKHERGYILVDDYLRTSSPHIFAAGDITGRMMLVQSAGYEARAAAENAVLGVGERNKHQIVPHGGFTDPEYASVGVTEEQAAKAGEYVAAVVPYSDLDRAVIDGRTEGFCKLIASRETHRMLGAHVVGEQAVEIVQIVAAGMAADMWVEQMAELEIAYPTYTAVVGLAARQIVRQLGVMPLAPQWQSLNQPHLAEWERREE